MAKTNKANQATRNIPEELIREILLKLPIKSLTRFQLVSKQWQSLIFNPVFTKSHLLSSPSSNSIRKSSPLNLIIHPDHSLSSLKFGANSGEYIKGGGLNLEPLQHVLPDIPSRPNDCGYLTCLGSCDGLICLCNWSNAKIYLCNPATKECRQIPSPERNKGLVAYGFGFVPSINDCEIVMIARYSRGSRYGGRRWMWFWEARVYNMKDDEWKELDNTSIIGMRFFDESDYSEGVLLGEALHWPVQRSLNEPISLLKFDLVKEIFEELPFVEKCDENGHLPYNVTWASTGIIEQNNLCVCQEAIGLNTSTRFVELWTLERYGEWDSWKKLFRFDFKGFVGGRGDPYLLSVASTGELLILIGDTGLAFVNATCDQPIYFVEDIEGSKLFRDPAFVMRYVPSLVSPHYYVPTSKGNVE